MKAMDVLIYDTTLRDGTQGEQISFPPRKRSGSPADWTTWGSISSGGVAGLESEGHAFF